jgi:predicted alpha-1,6-mannanase (GH76 family)
MSTRTRLAAACLVVLYLRLTPKRSFAGSRTFYRRASLALTELQSWYYWSKCYWFLPWTRGQCCPAGTWGTFEWRWWNSANALNNTVDFTLLSGDRSQLPLIQSAFANRRDEDYVARNFTDDEGWWALAWIDAYDLMAKSGSPFSSRYLERAQFIFSDMSKYWDPVCGGGIWWRKAPKSYKNAVANELFLAVAAKLYRRTHGDIYLTWATRETDWFVGRSTLYERGKLIPDGLDSVTCSVTGRASNVWTYNQGVIMGAMIELGNLDTAKEIADAVLRSSVLVRNGILTEIGEFNDGWDVNGNRQQYKGIFMRNLGTLYRALPKTDPERGSYGTFIRRNAEAIWSRDRGDAGPPRFGVHWSDPAAGESNQATQCSAVGALVAAISLDDEEAPTSVDASSKGSP